MAGPEFTVVDQADLELSAALWLSPPSAGITAYTAVPGLGS